MTRDDRMMAIVLMLRARRRVTARQLARMFSVTERTIYRDMQALMESEKVPIAATPGIEGGYELKPGYYVPPVMFTKDEAVALFLGATFIGDRKGTPFGETVDSALVKLESILPETARQPAIVTKDNVRWDIPEDKPAAHQSAHLRIIAEGIQTSRRIAIRYRNESGHTERTIAPYGIIFGDGKWYVVGWCYLRAALRMFRVDRIVYADLEDATFEKPETFDIDAYTDKQWAASLEARLREQAPGVTLRVPPRVLDELDRHWLYRFAKRKKLHDGRALVTIHDDDPTAVLRMVRAWGLEVEVMEPPELREQLRIEGEAMSRQYAPDAAGAD